MYTFRKNYGKVIFYEFKKRLPISDFYDQRQASFNFPFYLFGPVTTTYCAVDSSKFRHNSAWNYNLMLIIIVDLNKNRNKLLVAVCFHRSPIDGHYQALKVQNVIHFSNEILDRIW